MPADWRIWTWQDYWNDCKKFAKCLMHLGVQPFEVVNILGFNSPEWLLANTGAILASCIAAGIYTTNTAEACAYISQHSNAAVVVLEDNKQLAKYASLAPGSLPHLKCLVMWFEPIDQSIAAKLSVPVYTWTDFLLVGSDVSDADFEQRMGAALPGNCSTLIYTSGTTGPPKAVMISHDNVTWTTANMATNYFELNHADRVISYLPLSHIAAQLIDVHIPMLLGACTYFCQPDALKGNKICLDPPSSW
jgi:long-chain-fatty-acid--CoA ligase ACSBG